MIKNPPLDSIADLDALVALVSVQLCQSVAELLGSKSMSGSKAGEEQGLKPFLHSVPAVNLVLLYLLPVSFVLFLLSPW